MASVYRTRRVRHAKLTSAAGTRRAKASTCVTKSPALRFAQDLARKAVAAVAGSNPGSHVTRLLPETESERGGVRWRAAKVPGYSRESVAGPGL
jgi:hypothetical protein